MFGNNAEMEEIWAILAQEGRDNLSLVEEKCLSLEKNPDNREDIASLFRALHTFKGTVRMMDFSTTETLAHHAEDLVALARDEGIRLDGEMIDLLLVTLDQLRSLLEHILTYRADVEPGEVTAISEKLNELIRRKREECLSHKSDRPLPLNETPEDNPTPVKEESPTIENKEEFDISENFNEASVTDTDKPENEQFDSEKTTDHPIVDDDENKDEMIRQTKERRLENCNNEVIIPDMFLAEISGLHEAIEKIKNKPHKTISQRQKKNFLETVSVLRKTAEKMGYSHIWIILDEIRDMVAGLNPQGINSLDEKINALSTEIKEIIITKEDQAMDNNVNTSSLSESFNRQYYLQVKSDLESLNKLIERLKLDDILLKSRDAAGFDKLIYLLGRVYQSCLFYHLEMAATLTLTLQDLVFRIKQEEIPVTDSVTRLFETYMTQIGQLLESNVFSEKEKTQDPGVSLTLSALMGLAQHIIHSSSGPMLEITKNIVENLDISPWVKEMLTNENLAEISQSLRAGLTLFTITADMENNPLLEEKLNQWFESGNNTLLFSMAVDQEGGSRRIYLFASSLEIENITSQMKAIDPGEDALFLTICKSGKNIEPAFILKEEDSNITPTGNLQQTNGNISFELISELNEMVGGLVADQSTLQHVISRLKDNHPIDDLQKVIKSHLPPEYLGNDEWEILRRGLNEFWAPWDRAIQSLSQAGIRSNASLVQLQEKIHLLGAKPASEILNPLSNICKSLAYRLGKQVVFQGFGADIELDHHAINILNKTVNNLIIFCVRESIESPEQRRKAGKSAVGTIKVTVSRTENNSQVIVEDDGMGLDTSKYFARMQELGLKNEKEEKNSLAKWLFKPGFYWNNADESVNLAKISDELLQHRGLIDLENRPGQGLIFTINIPLDMAVLDSMVIRIKDIKYIIPVYAIRHILEPESHQIIKKSADGYGRLLNLDGKTYPVRELAGGFKESSKVADEENPHLLVIIEKKKQAIALAVDELIGRQPVLVRPVSSHLIDSQNILGCALLGEDEVGMVLNLERL